MLTAPTTIGTPRLTLRQPTPEDEEAIFIYASDAEVTRYMSWPVHQGIEATRRFLELTLESWKREGVGAYLIERDGAVVGSTGLDPSGEGVAATGYVLARYVWGKGYATEACRVMIDLGRSLGFVRVEANCHVDHTASARVLEKSGMRFEGIMRSKALFPNLSAEIQDVRCYAWTP
jgi:ribosomal-protein-alanine N-acetyltransferase